MTGSADDHAVKMRELDIREKEIFTKRLLGIVKIITTGIVVTLIPAILTHLVQKQELEIQTLKGEIKYLKEFSEKVVERDDLTKRRNFVQYLAIVAHSKESRNRWKEYLIIVEKAAKEQERIENELYVKSAVAEKEEQKVFELERKVEAASTEKSKNLEELKKQLQVAQDSLRSLDQQILEKSAERDALIQRSRLRVDHETSRGEIPILVAQMNSDERSVRLLSVEKLITKHRASPLAITLALDNLKPPLLEKLSASGRINVLVFLRNTAQSAWTNDLILRGKEAIDLIRKRNSENIAQIGPQTIDALEKFEKFLSGMENPL